MTPEEQAALLARAENLALRLAFDGYSPRQIVERTGLSYLHLRDLIAAHNAKPRRKTDVCPEPACGVARDTPGRPRSGWLQVKTAASKAGTWFCSWPCLLGHALRHTPALPTAQEQLP